MAATTPDPNDVAVLIPRVRRAIDGPMATAENSPSTTYSDAELKGVIADAIGEILFYTGGLFPHELNVASRDATYGAPESWTVDPPLTEPESAVVAAQAAINAYFFNLKELKTQETIGDEGQTWSYSISATLVRDQLQYLIRLRDQALAQLEEGSALEVYSSFVHTRDVIASAYVEPWIEPGGYPQGMEVDLR
jgi:hypothetical protein